MALSTDDLIKLKELIIKEIGKDLADIKSNMATKEDLLEIKDIVVGIRKELDTEHELRYNKLEENSRRIQTIEQHVGL